MGDAVDQPLQSVELVCCAAVVAHVQHLPVLLLQALHACGMWPRTGPTEMVYEREQGSERTAMRLALRSCQPT